MLHLIDAVRQSARDKNWYAALTGALALPDIAAKMDGLPGTTSARYIAWFDAYLLANFTRGLGSGGGAHVFLTGPDCYALRCAFLHAGDFEIGAQPIGNVLDRVHFVLPGPSSLYRGQFDGALYLRVDAFCEQVCAAVEGWLQARGNDPAVAERVLRLPQIINMDAVRKLSAVGPL